MRKVLEIESDVVNELFYYDENSPSGLRWKILRANNKVKIGDTAGSIHTDTRTGRKCWHVTINNKRYLAHRVVFVLLHGTVNVDLEVDHIDGNSMNNKKDNLRTVQKAVNQRNAKMRSDNTTGVTGVQYQVRQNRYVACYCDSSGKERCKGFSCKRFGKDGAFKLACEYRKQMIILRNSELGQERAYTEQHGLKRTT